MHIPPDDKTDGIDMDMLYHLLGDEIFPLEPWLMRPYPGNQPEPEQIYNYRHSRSRLPIENSFGILVARWRIFETPIQAKPGNVKPYVLACICLHNYLRLTENSCYTPRGFIDVATKGGDIKHVEWRSHQVQDSAIKPITKIKGRKNKSHAKLVREKLKVYVNEENILSWQVAKVRSVGPSPDSDLEQENV